MNKTDAMLMRNGDGAITILQPGCGGGEARSLGEGGHEFIPVATMDSSQFVVPEKELGFNVARFLDHIREYRNEKYPSVGWLNAKVRRIRKVVETAAVTYRLQAGIPAIAFDVFLPVKAKYRRVEKQVLDAFQSPNGIVSIPAVQAYLESHGDDRAAIVDVLGKIIQGYYKFKVLGRFGLEDEMSWVTRIIVYNPSNDGGMRGLFGNLARDVINHLVARRLAEHLGTESEVWVQEHPPCHIHRWVKESSPAILTA